MVTHDPDVRRYISRQVVLMDGHVADGAQAETDTQKR